MTTVLNESERQRALDLYRIVDSFPEAAYDDIAKLASALCDVPIALVSLIDRDRQWFKAHHGLGISETGRDVAFCDHAIRTPEQLMEVKDATRDPRFADNPLVTGDLSIRFYAGMPLVTPGGAPVGTVCVIDHDRRELNERQREGLAALARLTVNLLEARHRERELERAVLFAAQAAMGGEAAVEPASRDHSQCTIAIFEVQGLAAAVARQGERAVRRAMAQLEALLHAALPPGSHDSVNHATDSADLIAVLHGADTESALQRLQDVLPEFERASGLRVLVASAHSQVVDEPLEQIFVRADEALSQVKDALHPPPVT